MMKIERKKKANKGERAKLDNDGRTGKERGTERRGRGGGKPIGQHVPSSSAKPGIFPIW